MIFDCNIEYDSDFSFQISNDVCSFAWIFPFRYDVIIEYDTHGKVDFHEYHR